jgi:hypothetical protein
LFGPQDFFESNPKLPVEEWAFHLGLKNQSIHHVVKDVREEHRPNFQGLLVPGGEFVAKRQREPALVDPRAHHFLPRIVVGYLGG